MPPAPIDTPVNGHPKVARDTWRGTVHGEESFLSTPHGTRCSTRSSCGMPSCLPSKGSPRIMCVSSSPRRDKEKMSPSIDYNAVSVEGIVRGCLGKAQEQLIQELRYFSSKQDPDSSTPRKLNARKSSFGNTTVHEIFDRSSEGSHTKKVTIPGESTEHELERRSDSSSKRNSCRRATEVMQSHDTKAIFNMLQEARNTRNKKTRHLGALPKAGARACPHIMYLLGHPKTEQTLDFCMSAIVILNVAQLGISGDLYRNWAGWIVVDGFFAAAFLFEFCAKLGIHGSYYTFVKSWKWTLFDGVIVAAAVLELATAIYGVDQGVYFRAVRLMRLVRIVKVLRLPMFKDLLLMCDGLIGQWRTLFWSVVLLMAPVYVCAIILRETLGIEDVQETAGKGGHHQNNLVHPFASLPWSFFTTFRCIMGDCSAESGQPLPVLISKKYGWSFAFFYVLLIVITSFGLFNVIIAIYVENIVVSAKKKEARERHLRFSDNSRLQVLLAELVGVFWELDHIERGSTRETFMERPTEFRSKLEVTTTNSFKRASSVDAEEAAAMQITKPFFERVVGTNKVKQIFDDLDVQEEDRSDLFDILDADASGCLTLAEILDGLKKLRGPPRRSDVVANGLVTRAMQRRIHIETDHIFNLVGDNTHELRCLQAESALTKREIGEQLKDLRLYIIQAQEFSLSTGLPRNPCPSPRMTLSTLIGPPQFLT